MTTRASSIRSSFEAVTAPPGPALVIAGAGSGKTRTLTYRVAYLIEQGIGPEHILLLTFTNKAAQEMMRRVTDLLGQELGSLWGGTFHSIGNRVLRRHADLLGYRRDFSILDRADAKGLITTCVAESDIDTKAAPFPKAEVLAEIFSLAVNTLRTTEQVLEEQYGHFSPVSDLIAEAQRLYAARKRASNAMDFDDLLALWLELLRQQPEVLEHYQHRFQFILVDEYQDTNKLQSDLIDLLAARHQNVMVVGDDAQSIYSWRGANFHNILKFPDRYPGAALYKVETNYRSTPEILEAANAAIAANTRQYVKLLTPVRKPGPKPAVVVCSNSSGQAEFVARRLVQLHEEGADLNRTAVLYRSHSHALELQLELTRRHIPFSITSGIRFFEQAHIKDVTAYLKLVANPRDESAFVRLVRLLPGIGGKGAMRLWRAFSAGAPPDATASGHGEDGRTPAEPPDAASLPPGPAVARALQRCAALVPKKTAAAWAQFSATIAQLEGEDLRHDPSAMLRLVLEAGYEDYLKENYTHYRSRLEDLQQLASFATQFEALEDFLSQLALLTNVEAEEDRPAPAEDEQVRLSTIHQAKGLEFERRLRHHVVRWALPVGAFFEGPWRGGGGAPAHVCGHHARAPGALPELSLDPGRLPQRRAHGPAAFTIPG